ncbi:MAG: ABC transporter substrate-binding protein [Chloroflexi bacterium]|nr:ABC transporter substrate-binding protein [Chloroflexota bacterium]
MRGPTRIAFGLVTVLIVAACGSSTPGQSSSQTSAAPAAGSASAAVGSPAPTPQATPSTLPLRVGWLSEPDSMNPLTFTTTEAQEVLQLVYDTLLSYDLNLKPEPGLATAYSYSSDGLTETLNLRSGVTWHDGQPFTAADVKYTYDLIHDNQLGQWAQWLIHLKSVAAPDPLTVVLTFDKPQAFNPALIVPILPKHIWSTMTVKQIEAFSNDKPIGTGPFTFTEWKKGASITVSRNPAFWGPPPSEATVTWVLYGNGDVMAQALKNAEIDIIAQVPPTIYDGLAGASSIKTVSLPSFSFHHIGFNVSSDPKSLGNPLLRDRNIRQALSYALDRNQLVQLALAGHGQPGDTIIPAGLSDWHLSIPAAQQLNADPAKANQILDQAGYTARDSSGIRKAPNGKLLEFRLIAIATTDVDVRAAQLFRDAAKAVGIKLDLQTLDSNTLSNVVYNAAAPNWDIFVWGWDSGVPDPDYMLGVPLCSQIGGNNDVYYCNKQYDALYDQQASTMDPLARKQLVDQMQQLYYGDTAYIVMWYQDKLQAYRTDTWQGWTDVKGGIIFNFTRDNYLRITPAH